MTTTIKNINIDNNNLVINYSVPSSGKGTDYIKNTLKFTESMWNNIFPYTVVSSLWTTDNTPYWNYNSLMDAIDFLDNHSNPKFNGFASSNSNPLINKLELCAFLANMQQEVGEPTLIVPSDFNLCNSNELCQENSWCDTNHPCSTDCNQVCNMKTQWTGECKCSPGYEWNSDVKKCTEGGKIPDDKTVCNNNNLCNGSAGGGIQLIEGALITNIIVSEKGKYSFPESLNVKNCKIDATIPNLKDANQPGFGLGSSSISLSTGVNLAAVSSDGTLYTSTIDYSTFTKSNFWDSPWNTQHNHDTECKNDKTSAKCNCLDGDIFCQYGGRGAIQLSYYFNYSPCSLELFGDFRLIIWPNLIIGTNNGGTVIDIPEDVLKDTPDPKILGWLTCFWFWMTNRSKYPFSSHDSMQKGYGITCVNSIVNGQSGCTEGTWAYEKNKYFKRICHAFKISENDIINNIKCPIDPNCKK